jgi:hypothetical protein
VFAVEAVPSDNATLQATLLLPKLDDLGWII